MGMSIWGGSVHPIPSQRPADPVFSEIIPGKLYVSNFEGAEDKANLLMHKISHIVCLLRTRQSDTNLPPQIKRIQVPIVDMGTAVVEF